MQTLHKIVGEKLGSIRQQQTDHLKVVEHSRAAAKDLVSSAAILLESQELRKIARHKEEECSALKQQVEETAAAFKVTVENCKAEHQIAANRHDKEEADLKAEHKVRMELLSTELHNMKRDKDKLQQKLEEEHQEAASFMCQLGDGGVDASWKRKFCLLKAENEKLNEEGERLKRLCNKSL